MPVGMCLSLLWLIAFAFAFAFAVAFALALLASASALVDGPGQMSNVSKIDLMSGLPSRDICRGFQRGR